MIEQMKKEFGLFSRANLKNMANNGQIIEKGLSKLDNSDVYVGSYFSRDDVKTILSINKIDKEVDDEKLKEIAPKKWNGNYISQEDLSKKWKKFCKTDKGQLYYGKASIDEYILVAIIKKTYPSASIVQQECIKFSNKHKMFIDISLELNNKKKFIEFHGPLHFIRKQGEQLKNPFDRKSEIENKFPNVKYIIWPYWIQKCTKNLKIALGEIDDNGFGALWGTEKLFGSFNFHNSADIIKEITQQFNAAPNDDFGYFYEENSCGRKMPGHPIIEKILQGEEDINKLIPKGVDKNNKTEIDLWLPSKLKGKYNGLNDNFNKTNSI
jgi:hypothetical protein